MRILLLSAYDAHSHRRWRQILRAEFADFEWHTLTLPPRYFSWRIRGNSLSWSQNEKKILSSPYDLLIATSMTDLATLRGLVPQLCNLPTLLYFHENQFAYPANQSPYGMVEAQMVSIYSALAADQLAFNSNYNLQSFLQGVSELFSKLPDHVPRGVVDQLKKKSQVIPVPILPHASFVSRTNNHEKLSIVWNHRWEYDKGPKRLLNLVNVLKKLNNRKYHLHIVGQQFRTLPKEFEHIKKVIQCSQNLSLGYWGFVKSEVDYKMILSACDVVLSTALHDFQGLSVLDAVAVGCIPVVPDRLAYQELFEQDYRYDVDEDKLEVEANSAAVKLEIIAELKSKKQLLSVPSVEFLSPDVLSNKYRLCFENLIKCKS